MVLLLQFFLAHILGDFFLQWKGMVADKEAKSWRSGYLYLHGLIHFILTIVVTTTFSFWRQALTVAILHILIDILKTKVQSTTNRRNWFFVDQILHLITIISVWSYTKNMVIDVAAFTDKENLVLITAVLFLLQPTSFIIKVAVSKWTPQIPQSSADSSSANGNASESLMNAGQMIGIIERLLILIFILLGKWEGVGFLLTAKSVFRFGDLKEAKEKKLTEYVLIGTFLSFGIAVVIGLIVLKALGKIVF